jgi:hypothetical protein
MTTGSEEMIMEKRGAGSESVQSENRLRTPGESCRLGIKEAHDSGCATVG